MSETKPIWFFWGQRSMTFLRWMTLLSASQIHDDVRIVLRKNPVDTDVTWSWEKQDWQFESPAYVQLDEGCSELDAIGVKHIWLEDIAQGIAEMNLPDVQTSDLFGWWILANRGGTVADMDIVFLKPLPKIESDVQVVRFTGYPKPGYVPVTFMQGRPCELWREVYATALVSACPAKYESAGSPNLPVDVVGTLPERIVFPWAGLAFSGMWRHWMFGSKVWPAFPEETIGLHWYAGGNQQWNQKITGPDMLPDGAMSMVVREVLAREGEHCKLL